MGLSFGKKINVMLGRGITHFLILFILSFSSMDGFAWLSQHLRRDSRHYGIYPLVKKNVALGADKTFAITSVGVGQSWGSDYESINLVYGQLGLGLGSNTTRSTPQTLDDITSNFVSITSGETGSCALTTTGQVKCWGDGNGDGTGAVKNSPTAIADGGTQIYIDIATGSYHSCAVTSHGALTCWGDGWEGKLGNGDGLGNFQAAPVSAFSGATFKKVAAGRNHTCAITAANYIQCWGTNSAGQLGDTTTTSPRLAPVDVDPGVQYSEVSAGEDSSCGITTTGVLKCWGDNAFGQLGDNSKIGRPTPTVIDAGTNYKKIALSATYFLHTCGITASDDLKCWGYNGNGALGDGTTTESLVPITIDAGIKYREVAVTVQTTCGITLAGQLRCWGANGVSQLGIGNTIQKTTPQVVGSGY